MRNFVLYILLFTSTIVFAQPDNDECRFATFIESVDGYCSANGEFSNVGATSDPSFSNTCFGGFENGVWFSFVPREPAVAIQIFSSGTTGSLRFPKIFLFASCNEFVECSPGKDASSDEMVYNGLIIGQVYYIMIESERGAEGNFQLCIDDFIAPKSPESDCGDAVVLCDKSTFRIENLNSAGSNTNELDENSCIPDEFASSWYTWTCDVSGTLTFELIPNNNGIDAITDDLDFVIFELPNGPNNCSGKREVRCMASGANTNGDGSTAPLAQWAQCNGTTGLRTGETDIIETGGCLGVSNNYIAPLNMESGKSYGLIVNNFSRSGLGFEIEFGGTGTFLGPQPDFDLSAVQAFECDKTIIFNNLSFSDTDSIISYQWNFGAGASQFFGDGPGPHDIVYESFVIRLLP